MTSEPFPKDCIAVLGSATHYTPQQVVAAFQIGREIGRCGKAVITGATSGIPYAAAIGAKSVGALVIGVSPATNAEEHISIYAKPMTYLDVIVFTGLGLEGRNPINVRSVRGAIFVAGEFGTLNEFSAACVLGNKVLGVLEGVGGISSFIPSLIQHLHVRPDTDILFDSNPVNLSRRICREIDRTHSLQSFQSVSSDLGRDVREVISDFVSTEKEELHIRLACREI